MQEAIMFVGIVTGGLVMGAVSFAFVGLYKLIWSVISTTEEESTIEAKKLGELINK